MINSHAFANAFAGASVLLYVLIFALKIIAPPFFKLIINSQFLGADVASQIPRITLANFLGILIAIGVVSWIFGFLVAEIYNRQTKN